jgi:hypothetical protein
MCVEIRNGSSVGESVASNFFAKNRELAFGSQLKSSAKPCRLEGRFSICPDPITAINPSFHQGSSLF